MGWLVGDTDGLRLGCNVGLDVVGFPEGDELRIDVTGERLGLEVTWEELGIDVTRGELGLSVFDFSVGRVVGLDVAAGLAEGDELGLSVSVVGRAVWDGFWLGVGAMVPATL